MSIFIAANFCCTHFLQLCYQGPRPFWLDEGSKIKVFSCSKGYANPCGHAISIAMFATFLVYEHKVYGFVFGLLAVMLFSLDRLILGVNTFNQVIFGLQIGIWISCTILYTIDYKLRITRHFQKMIRGRSIEFQIPSRVLVFSTSYLVLLFLAAYYISQLTYSNSKVKKYFDNLQKNCNLTDSVSASKSE